MTPSWALEPAANAFASSAAARVHVLLALSLVAVASVAAGCSSSPSEESGPSDSGADAAVTSEDASATTCPAPRSGLDCQTSSDCAPLLDPPDNCQACLPYGHALCLDGECLEPPLTSSSSPHTVLFSVAPGMGSELKSFAGLVVDGVTTGGTQISCAAIDPRTVASSCLNVMDSRVLANIARPDDAYSFPFSRLPAGRDVLFLIEGFGAEGAQGDPIGLSCTEYQVCASCEDGVQRIAGTMMTRL